MHLCTGTRVIRLCTVLLSMSLALRPCLSESEGAWYRGCFMQTGDIFKNDGEINGDLTKCSTECMNNRYYFIALQGDRCCCLSRVDNLFPAAEDMCDSRCTGLEETNLPCGGQIANSWSVYAASGPFIVKVEPQETSQRIEPNIPTALEAVVVFREFVDITGEHLIESEWGNTVEFTWQSEFKVVSVNISANSSQELAMCTLTFPNTGRFPVGLKVRNLLSSVQADFIVTVEVPKPRDIQLRAIINEWLLPSCIPLTEHLKNTRKSRHNPDEPGIANRKTIEQNLEVRPLVAVFVNTPFALQVSVTTGSDLVFNINIWNGHRWETFQPVAGEAGTLCDTPLACRSVIQSYRFKSTGVFPVSATVSNQFGIVEGNLTIVAVDEDITDATAMLVSSDSSVVHTETNLLFHLTAITADRRNTEIRVNFGDGITKNAKLREKQNISLEDSSSPTLFASYGEGCNLSLQFDHEYRTEGVFVPAIALYNNRSYVAFQLKKEITVVNEILGLEIKCPEFVPANQPVELFIKYSSISSNRTVVWTILDDSHNVVANESTWSLEFVFKFVLVGRYKIVSTVSNLLSSKTAHAHVIVQESVGGVNLSCIGGPYIEVKQDIVCTAKAEFGSDVHFKWDFQDKEPSDVRSGNLTTTAKHTFSTPGVYNISVRAHNNVTHIVEQLHYRIHVEIPVECLNVITKVPPVLGEAVSFVAIATRGTSLTFFLDVSPDVKISPHEVEVYGNGTKFHVRHVFPGPGTHQVMVLAYNHISNTSRSVDVHVQEAPPEFTIQVLPAPLPHFRIVALKDSQGGYIQRGDLLFHFGFPDGTAHITQVPLVIWQVKQRRFTRDSIHDHHDDGVVGKDVRDIWLDSQLQVNVTVSNKVGHTSQVLSLANNGSSVESDIGRAKKKRKERRKPVFWHSTFVKTGEFTSFLLANKSKDISSVDVDYGDGKKESVSCLSESCSWGRKFHHPGVFALDVSLTGRKTNRQDHAVGSVLVVEEEIRGLRILGPTDVGIGCDQEWTAELKTGSHIVYVWSLDGVPDKPTTVSKYVAGFSKPGNHTLQLNVSNDISTAQASLSVTVKHPITDVSLDIAPSFLGTSTGLTVEIEGGREFTIECSFGDGQYTTFPPGNLTIVKLGDSPIPTLSLESHAPTYRTVLKHYYKTAGEYNVSVTVHNGISSFHRIANAVVEEAIGDIVLSTENSPILAIDDHLVVTAVVSSGQNLKFFWNFSDELPLTVHSDGNSSTVSHMFNVAKEYEVSVTVSNHLQKDRRATLPFLVNVVEPISDLTLIHKNDTNCPKNVAPIWLQSDGSNSTHEVQFEARTSGTSVEFMFNFGDGHSKTVKGTDNVYLMIEASVKHVYTREGTYRVSVTASNPLGNITVFLQEDFCVQFPPSGLKIVASEHCVQLGKTISLNATVQSGTNVSFTWKFYDQTEIVNRSESNVEHQYLQSGKKFIEVTAKNKVNATVSLLTVEVVEKILDVNLSVNSTLVVAGEPVHHLITVHPPSAQSEAMYNWLHGSKHRNFKQVSWIQGYEYGRQYVQVTATNCLSSVKSALVEIHVFEQLDSLTFDIIGGTTIVSTPVVFMASHYRGDDLHSYTWNFGDGSQNFATKKALIFHNYSQIGEYIVKLHAENPVSQQDVSRKIFVLTKPCSPPTIKVVGVETARNKTELMFLYSEPVRVEAEVNMKCNTSSSVKFIWKVVDVNRQPVKHLVSWAMKNQKNHFHCPSLLLPARTLEIGQYLVHLTVEMNDTEIPVYSELEVIISVFATPLVSVIRGGISRYVGQENNIFLDGSESGYPDNSSAILRFNWTCYPLPTIAYDCFQSPNQVPAMNETQLIFPSSWLNSNFTQFRFDLTVLRIDDQGMIVESATSDQVIEWKPMHRTLDLLLECSQCWHNTVNFHRKVSIRVHCPTCSRGPLTYTWKLETLTLENQDQEFTPKGFVVCSETAGTDLIYWRKPVDVVKGRIKNMENITNATIQSSNTTSSATTVIDGVIRPQTQPELITDTITERQESRANERQDELHSVTLPDPTEVKIGRRIIHIDAGRYRVANSTSATAEDLCGSLCIRHIAPAAPSPDHLINKMKDSVRLTHDQTLTGLDQPSLVIKPGVLQPGRTYFVEVRAAAADGTSGMATFYLDVNGIPWKGKCTLRPYKGIALTTVFTVWCYDWIDKDENLPLHYEISYNLDKSEVPENLLIVYYGMKNEIKFQLPAGLAKNDYKVLVQAAIINRLGATTLTCFAAVEVLPQTAIGPGATELLLNETQRLYQGARDSVYEGARDDLYGPLTLVASSLNALNNLGHVETGRAIDSALARENIMDTLTYLTLRDEVEVTQALQCLVETTGGPDQLTGETVLKSRQLLKLISDQVKSVFVARTEGGWSRDLNTHILSLAARVASNLLLALENNDQLFIATGQQSRMYESITRDLLQMVNSLVQLELQSYSLGEQPLILQDKFISLNASHYSLYHLSPLTMNGVQFQLPSSLENLLRHHQKKHIIALDTDVVGRNSQQLADYENLHLCFQARSLSFPSNPFSFLTRETDLVQSQLASLNIYSCFGDEEIKVQNLPSTDMVTMIIPRKAHPVLRTDFRKHYLNKTAMNIHQMNASISHNNENFNDFMDMQDKYLHIHIQLQPVFEGLTFPVMVIISDTARNLSHYIFKQVYNTEDIKILLSPGTIESGNQYHIGIVDASFNKGRRRSTEIEGRYYTLNIWWGACVYWNHTDKKWRGDGCGVSQIANVDELHCRCNHLTTFGGYFELIPNDLTSLDVNELFSLHENPVAVVLIGVAVLLYIVLAAILRQADIHDSKKGNCVYLQDNSPTHRQKYEVFMETGCCRDAGTTSKISIILHGEEGVSETRELISDDNYPMFESKSRDRFIVTLPESLGKIFKIQLWHNNSGSSPGWFLRQVVVRDLNTGQAFYFLCQKWLAVDKDDGKVEREFTAIDGRNISFGMIFWYKGSQYLTDFHTWLSVWTCPPHSHFTRVQRLTVCFTLLMAYMCLSAMWFKQIPSQIRGEFGLLDLSWYNVIVGCICCAVVLPLNLILSFMFRRSRVRYPSYEQDQALLSSKSGCELASECDDEAVQSTVTYSILDQSILNWQNIQDWAQKQWLKRQQLGRSSANSVKTSQTSPQLSVPSTTPLVQQTLLAEDDTDQASSGFEDATSQVIADRQRIKPTSDIISDGKKSRIESSDVLSVSRRIFLPFWFRYVAWILCVLISGACGAVTILYGFRFGHTLSVMWIQSVYFSFMVCLFIAQPFLILISVVYTAVCHRSNPAVFDHFDDGFYGEKMVLAGLQKQRPHYHEEEGELQRGVAERSRSRYLRFAGPPQEKQLKSSRKKLIKQKRAMLFLSDSVWFIVMFTLLCIIAFGKDLQAPYRLNKTLKQAFNGKQQLNSPSFSKLKSSSEWYHWSQSVLVDTLFKQTSLRDESNCMDESLGFVIGHVQLRQLRVAPEPCYNIGISEADQICLYGYSTNRQDSFDPGKSWLTYSTGDQTTNPGLWGQAAWYGSSGYVLQLNNSRKIAAEQLAMLEAEKWIDIQTRAVFVELTLFNAASNLFSSVTLLLERTAAGQVMTSSHIMSSYVFRYVSVWDNCILGCELLYIVLTLLMLYHLMRRVMKLGRAYFSHFWNYIELTVTMLSMLYMEFYIYRFVLVSEAVEFIRSTFYEEFINLNFLTWWDELLRALVGAILFCVTVRLLRVLRYHQVFWRLQIVFRRCKLELLMAAALYGGFIMGFSSLSTALFGPVVYSLRSLWSSVLAMSALSARAFHWESSNSTISNQSPWLDIVLLFAFTFCHGFIVTYIFAALANKLKRTRNSKVLSLTCNQLMTLYLDSALKWAGWRPEVTHQQTDNTLPPEFTMAEILYLVEEMLFRMNALLGMSGLPDKRHSFTDSDATANGGDDGISSGGSEDPPIPVNSAVTVEGTRLEHCVQKIEDKLCSNEPYLAQLLKLDSIGTNILSEEKEQELMSHLEFEIFRQLQMQRQESAVVDVTDHTNMACPLTEPLVSVNFAASKTFGPASPGHTNFPHEIIFTQDGAIGRIPIHPSPQLKTDSLSLPKTNPEPSVCSQEVNCEIKVTLDNPAVPLKAILLLPPKRSQSMKIAGSQAGRHQITESLRNQKHWLDLSTSEATREAKLSAKFMNSVSTPKYPKVCVKKDMQSIGIGSERKVKSDITFKQEVPILKRFTPEASVKIRESKCGRQDFSATAATFNASLSNVSPQSSESEKGHKRSDSSSGQSGHERNETPRQSFKRPELPPKPTFSHVILPALESSKAMAGWSPKPRQFTFLPELMNSVGAESSSGSEQEATLSGKRVVQGRRNLRKTKSRGKGKGNEGSIASPMVLVADFASSNQSDAPDVEVIIHPVPTGINPDDYTVPEEYLC